MRAGAGADSIGLHNVVIAASVVGASGWEKTMVRLLIRLLIFFVTAALGLLIAAWLVDGFHVTISGFLFTVAIFAIAQSVLTPFAMKMAHRHAKGLLGGIGLFSTFLALLVSTFLPGGIRITTVSAWVIGTLVVWLATALGTWLLPVALLAKRGQERADG